MTKKKVNPLLDSIAVTRVHLILEIAELQQGVVACDVLEKIVKRQQDKKGES